MTTAVDLGGDERAAVRAATRRWCVRRSVMRVTPWNRVVLPVLSLIAMLTCLLLPVALSIVFIPHVRTATWGEAAVAVASYLTLFGVISTCYFAWIAQIRPLVRLGLAGVAVVIFAFAVGVTTVDRPASWVVYGLGAATVAAVVVWLGHWSGGLVWSTLWGPLWRRPLTAIAPTTSTIVLLWHLLDEFCRAPRAWHEPKARDGLIAAIFETFMWFDYRLPQAMRLAGQHGPAYETILHRHRQVAQFVADLSWRLLDARSTKDQAQVRLLIARTITAIVSGQWDTLPEPVRATRWSRLLAIGRRFIAPTLLAAAAFALPHLPGLAFTGPSLTSIQATLFAAAMLSLIPSDGSNRERAIDALRERN